MLYPYRLSLAKCRDPGDDADLNKLLTTNTYSTSPPSNMSSPAPLLRPPIPGGRQSSGTRTPRLGLAIPPSPSVRPVNGAAQQSARPPPPKLSLATPMGSTATPYEHNPLQKNGRPSLSLTTGQSASGGSESSAAH